MTNIKGKRRGIPICCVVVLENMKLFLVHPNSLKKKKKRWYCKHQGKGTARSTLRLRQLPKTYEGKSSKTKVCHRKRFWGGFNWNASLLTHKDSHFVRINGKKREQLEPIPYEFHGIRGIKKKNKSSELLKNLLNNCIMLERPKYSYIITYLPQAIWVTMLPISSKTFLGFISWLVELWPNWPYPPAPKVNTPPS